MYAVPMKREYCVYIMTNRRNTVLYTGVTADLVRRVRQHKAGRGGAFTAKYRIVKLVYYEMTDDIDAALRREKQIKGGSRRKKIDLIVSINPLWKDLARELY